MGGPALEGACGGLTGRGDPCRLLFFSERRTVRSTAHDMQRGRPEVETPGLAHGLRGAPSSAGLQRARRCCGPQSSRGCRLQTTGRAQGATHTRLAVGLLDHSEEVIELLT